MSPTWNMITALLAYVIIAIGSYLMGRMDENKKWAKIWFEQWRSICEGQIDMEKRLRELIVMTRIR